ncbi:MAG: hypothetical protein ACKV22_36850 [Bryobacteraceae bacterium]
MGLFVMCELCGKRLPLFSRQPYCSPAHQQLHENHQRSLYLARLADNAVEVRRLNTALEDRLMADCRKS